MPNRTPTTVCCLILQSAVIVCLLASGTPLHAQSNLLTNGTFDGSIAGWSSYNLPGVSATYAALDADGRAGSGSALLTYTESTANPVPTYTVLYQKVPVVAGTSYRLSAKIRPNSPNNFISVAFLGWYDANDQLIGGLTNALPYYISGGVWNTVSVTGTAPANAARAWVGLDIGLTPGAAAYYDDVSLVQTSQQQPPCPTMTTQNIFIAFNGSSSGCAPTGGTCSAGEAINFSAQTFGYSFSCSPHTFSWNFGDGTTTALQNPAHVYSSPSTYNVALTITNASQQITLATSLKVGGGSPEILSFVATPPSIALGRQATLSWTTRNATAVMIDPSLGAQPPAGSLTVTPGTTTTYRLTALSGSLTRTATATVKVIAAPIVVVSSLPDALLQTEGTGGARTTYALTNLGGTSTTITLGQTGTFFTQAPASFTLAPGGTQVVTISGQALPSGAYEGFSTPSGSGVQPGVRVPIKLLATASNNPPPVRAHPTTNRVDVTAPVAGSPSGTASFTNSGSGTLTGIVTTDVPWIVPQAGAITIPAGSTVPVSFVIDRSARADADALLGSAAGTLALSYLTSDAAAPGALDAAPRPATAKVTIVDSVEVPVTDGSAPPLATGELALFVPAVGHVAGSVGTFVSDIYLLNPLGAPALRDVRLFYARSGSPIAKAVTLPEVPAAISVALSDAVRNLFLLKEDQVGTLQVRSTAASKISLSSSVFNSTNPVGTYGTAIPTFRSDRAAGHGERLFLTGLRRDATTHTNILIQETAGIGVTVQTDFLSADGSILGSRSDVAGPFGLLQLNSVVPTGALSAILTNSSSEAGGRFLAYATPVDEASGDNWSVVDWPRQYAYDGGDAVIIPVAGSVHGASNTFFRTDVALMNTGAGQGSATLRYFDRNGDKGSAQITVGSHATTILEDVISTLNFAGPVPIGGREAVGYLVVAPVSGTFVITSRTYTTAQGRSGTYGTGVPTVAATQAMKAGELRTIAGVEESARFRANIGILETAGAAATVRVVLRYTARAGALVSQVGAAESKEYQLGPDQFVLVNLVSDIIGTRRSELGDLRNVQVDVQVTGGDGAVMAFVSSVDNGTGDSVLLTADAVGTAAASTPAGLQSKVVNGTFDSDISSWGWDDRYEQGNGSAAWTGTDASGNGTSGSLLLQSTSSLRAFQRLQCIAIPADSSYRYGGDVRSGTSTNGRMAFTMIEYASPDCSGAILRTDSITATPLPGGGWSHINRTTRSAPAAQSGHLVLAGGTLGSNIFDVYFDNVSLELSPP